MEHRTNIADTDEEFEEAVAEAEQHFCQAIEQFAMHFGFSKN